MGLFLPEHVDGLVGPVISAAHVAVLGLDVDLDFLGESLDVLGLAVFVVELNDDGLRESNLGFYGLSLRLDLDWFVFGLGLRLLVGRGYVILCHLHAIVGEFLIL